MANEFKVRKGLVVNGSGSVILDVQGSQGQLFSVTDQLSGSLFSVNDISGVPVLEAFSDSTVKIGQYLAEAIIVSGSTARITGSMSLAGFSTGSVLFAGTGGAISQNNSNFFWDNANGRLGIGTNAPDSSLTVPGNVRFGNTTNGQMFNSNTMTVYGNLFIGMPSDRHFSISNNSFTSIFFRVITNTGNVLIGTTADNGARLQVSGSSTFAGNMVITGSGTTSGTNALNVTNNSIVPLFTVRNDGAVFVQSVNTAATLYMSSNGDSSFQKSTSGTNGIICYGPASANHTLTISSFDSNNYQNGALSSLRFPGNFVSSAGSTAFSYMLIDGTINQTGASTSITRGLYINPTLTAAADWRSIEWSNNAATAPSASWGLYGSGTAPNYLAGSLLIGTTTPSMKLTLVDNISTYVAQFRGSASSYITVGDTSLGGESGVNLRNSSGAAFIALSGTTLGIAATSGANTLAFSTAGTEGMRLTVNRNTLLQNGGTFTDNGARLQVSGSSTFAGNMVITGSGATSATNAFVVQNSNLTSSFIVKNDGQVQVRSTNAGNPGYSFIDNTDTGLFITTLGGMYTAVDSVITVAYGSNGTAFNASGSTNSITSANLQLTKTGVGHRLSVWLNANNDFNFEAWENSVGYANNIVLNQFGGGVLLGTATSTGEKLQVVGTTKLSGNATITGSLTVTGTITAQTIVAQTITSSTSYMSGSTIFGNSLSNTHQFTGSVLVTGSLNTNGDVVIVGSGNTSATTALSIRNSSNQNIFRFRNDGLLQFGNSGLPVWIIPYSTVYDTTDINGQNISIYPLNGSISLGGATQAQTSGASNNIITKGRFQPTSGTATFVEVRCEPLINQTGGANGITRGLYVNPTLTAAADWRSIEWSNNASSVSGSWGLYGAGSAPNYLSGSLGIGTTTPSSSIHINSTTVNNAFLITTPNNNTTLYPFFIGGATLTSDNYLRANSSVLEFRRQGNPSTIRTAGSSNNLALEGSQHITFSTNGANERGRFTSGGNLLLNDTVDDTFNRLQITGNARISQALTSSQALISGSGTQRLTVVGSGSAQPLFTVQGSQGELFSIVDSLSGSLFSVNDISGLPIMEVFSDNTTLVGNYLAPMLLTTARTSSAAGINTIYTIPTSSYDAVYIDYTIRSGSNARAGNFMAMWSGTSVNFTDNSITEFGSTSGFVFGAHVSGANMVVTGSAPTAGWTIKTIIKAI